MSRELIEKFAKADLIEAIKMVKCGFELETVKSAGITWADSEAKKTARAAEMAKEQTGAIYSDWTKLSTYCSVLDSFLTRIPESKRRLMVELLDLRDIEKVADFFERDLRRLKEDVSSALIDNLRERGPKIIFPEICDNDQIQVKRDSSVTGFEFATLGPQSVESFADCLNQVMQIPHVVSEGCSFHIHMSLEGVKHSYSHPIAQAMYEYILIKCWDKIPSNIKTRWASANLGQYAAPTLKEQDPDGTNEVKYRFVSYRQQHKTWEFRCWGNINNTADAIACLQLSIEALQYAYKVKFLKTEPVLLPGCYDFSPLCRQSTRASFLDRYARMVDAA